MNIKIMPKKIYYWNTIFNKELIDQYPKILAKLESGDYKSADLDLKKSRSGASLYTVRLNDADRLLLTTIENTNHQPAIMLLEVIDNHDYQKSRFLKPAVLSAFLKNKAPEIIAKEEDFNAYMSDELDILNEATESDQPVEYVGLNYYNHQFVEFNDSQDNALHTSLPLIISGAAGSGKSCVAISLLANKAVEKSQLNEKVKLLYVTQSQFLVDSMHQLWQEHPSSKETGVTVEFKTYLKLLLEYNPDLRNYKIVGLKEFEIWIRDYIKKELKAAQVAKNASLTNFLKQQLNANLIYQEFRLLSGYSEPEYLGLGKQQSNFTEQEQRKWLFRTYQVYNDSLQQQQQFDPAFMRLNAQDQNDFVVNDEVHDNSHVQTQSLFKLAKEKAFACCTDSHQNTIDYQSKRSFLENLSSDMQTIELPGSYRCPKLILWFANRVISMKFIIAGGTSDKKEKTNISTYYSKSEGKVQWVEPSKAIIEEIKKTTSIRHDWIIIVAQEADKGKAQVEFKSRLVFSLDEIIKIKGLEYTGVILYQIFNHDLFYQANKHLSESENYKMHVYRPKAGEKHSEYVPLSNQVFTAITRATKDVIVIQASSHNLANVIGFLKEESKERESLIHQILEIESPVASSREEWQEEVDRQILNGNDQVAKEIWMDNLKWSESDFETYYIARTKNFIVPEEVEQKIEPRSESNKQILLEQESQATNQATSTKRNARPRSKKKQSSNSEYHAFLDTCANGDLTEESPYIADSKLIDSNNTKPISHAFNHQRYRNVGLLLSAGYSVHKNDFIVMLHFFIEAEKVGFTKKLLNQLPRIGADAINVKNKGITALHIASAKGNSEIVEMLLNSGANVSICDNLNRTPLHLAAGGGHTSVIEILVKNGADLNISTMTGRTPLDFAYFSNQKEAINLLTLNGAKRKFYNIPETLPSFSAFSSVAVAEKSQKEKIFPQAKSSNSCTFWSVLAVGIVVTSVVTTSYFF